MGKTELTYEDIETYLPQYDFDEKQIQFFKETFEIIMHNRDTSKVTCFADRPGIGKSTLIKALIHCCIGYDAFKGQYEPIGLIIITDSMKRLDGLSDGKRDRIEAEECWGELFEEWGIKYHYKEFEKNVIVLKSDVPFLEQLQKQHYKPIVLMSTQRYFMLSKKVRDQLFTFNYKGEVHKRNTIIFDECPYFSETVQINSYNLAMIETALLEGLSDEVEDKEFATREFSVFKNRLIDQMAKNEKEIENSDVILYWKDERYPTITPNDTLFFKVVEDNMESLTQKYSAVLKDLESLREMAQKGALFYCFKKKRGNNYERSFVLVRDNREAFYLGQDKKFFVFDATADVDPRYDLDYVEIVDGKKYNNPLSMKITNVNIPTSKTTLCNGRKQSIKITDVIKKYINNRIVDGIGKQRKVLIVTYKSLCNRFNREFSYVGYFGNLKGFNDYKDIYKMAHIGMNRYSPMAYFYIYCGCHMDKYKELSKMSKKESLEYLTNLVQKQECQEFLNDVMIRCILADFEQNIFRLAIRNYGNEDNVHIWTFYNIDGGIYDALSTAIENRYRQYGVTFEYEDAPIEFQISKLQDRKPPDGKEETNAQRIVNWRNSLPDKTGYKVQDLLKGTGLTNKQFQKAKSKNPLLANILKADKTDKKGYYCKTAM